MRKNIKLLVIEDSDMDFDLLLLELKQAGYETSHTRVQTAEEFETALKADWDLIISDYSVPSFGANAALEIVKERGKQVPFIVVSGSIGEERAIKVLKAGANDFITKENLSRLLPTIEREMRDAAEREARKKAEDSLREVEEQLRQSQKLEAIGKLAGGVAHDFNNLLTIINGRCQLAMSKGGHDAELHRELNLIFEAGTRAAALTRQLLAFSRKQVLTPRVLDLNAIISDLEVLLSRLLGEDVILRKNLTSSAAMVKADRSQIEQVVMNLAVNARDAMPNGGDLVIETQITELDQAYANIHPDFLPGEYVLLSVSDTGCGMPDDVKAKIFEPFYTTKEQGRGTGLGLSTVYGIIMQTGGHIWVYSVPDQGTVFKIYLPHVHEAQTDTQQESSLVQDASPGETILVVEDEEAIRDLIQKVLEARGYTILVARNGIEALEILERCTTSIHLLITDVVMPKMSGRELADQALIAMPEVKLLFMSGFTDDALVNRGILDGKVAFLEKPFSIEGLALKVRRTLDN